jgi:hypothetical protein
MTGLRWTLIVVTAFLATGWVLLVIWADGFRRSFGASSTGGIAIVLPFIVMALILASLFLPDQKWLQHLSALAAVAVVAACLVVMSETVLMAMLGLTYMGLWLLHYWHTVWRASPAAG